MRKFLFVILLLAQISFSQSIYDNGKCIRSKNFSEKERLLNFPFSKSKQIKVISLKNKTEGFTGVELMRHINSIVLGKDIFKPEYYDETATLNTEQINKLTDIVFNFTYTRLPHEFVDTMCYMPRNAILFLDSNNKIIAYLEICFGCDHYKSSDKRLNIGEYCTTKYDMLKSIFEESNIKYGISIVD
ncbi:hypothetical protein [Flavobacterium panacagri]|uniref:hypothetical protein n=1 Tax=Flavobacterium panacagri TaxID=3034146 RepID=UPI0025A545BF|nr:hypothetical protein [Flavobacterium panacagri]